MERISVFKWLLNNPSSSTHNNVNATIMDWNMSTLAHVKNIIFSKRRLNHGQIIIWCSLL